MKIKPQNILNSTKTKLGKKIHRAKYVISTLYNWICKYVDNIIDNI